MLHTSRLLHSLWILIAALLVSACTGSSKASEPQICAAAQGVKPVLIHSYNGVRMSSLYGSGMWIDTEKGDNYFVTNAHVVLKPQYQNGTVTAIGAATAKPYLHGKVFLFNEKYDSVEAEVVALAYSSKPYTLGKTGYFAVNRDVAILKAKEMPSRFTKHLTQHKVKGAHEESFGYITGFKPRGGDYLKEINCYQTVNGLRTTQLLHPTDKSIPGQSGSGMLNSNLEITGLLSNAGTLHAKAKGQSSDNVYHARVTKNIAYFGIGKPKDANNNIFGFTTPGSWIIRLLDKLP